MKGYSLIEVLVVSTITIMLVMIGLPTYLNFNQQQKAMEAAEMLAQKLVSIQKLVVQGQAKDCAENYSLIGYKVALQINYSTVSFWAVCQLVPTISDRPLTSFALANGAVLKAVPIGERIKFEWPDGKTKLLVSGSWMVDNATIEVDVKGKKAYVCVSKGGSIKAQKDSDCTF